MNRREYLGAVAATLGAACAGDRGGEPGVRGAGLHAPPEGAGQALPGVVVVTDFAAEARARGSAEEDWGPAFEAAWNAAAATGTDVFVPAGTYRVRLRRREGGWGPAIDLLQPAKYRPVRMLGPARGAVLRLEAWPQGAPPGLPLLRLRSSVRSSAGTTDVAVAPEIAGLTLVNASGGPASGWTTAVDHRGVGMRLVGLYGAAVTACHFEGFSCGVVLGAEEGPAGVSYLTRVQACRFQYCNQAVRVPSTANATVVRDCTVVWQQAPRAGPVPAFQTAHATGSVLFAENHVEMCAAYVYEFGASTNVRVSGGRLESVYGVARVRGTGSFPARATRIEGLSVDCDALRFPAIWLERSAGALLSGVTFYQNRGPHPHLRVDAGAARTSLLLVESADSPLRVVDPAGSVRRLG